jgi:hypothetical protein
MQTFYYLDQLCEYLLFWRREIQFGQSERSLPQKIAENISMRNDLKQSSNY